MALLPKKSKPSTDKSPDLAVAYGVRRQAKKKMAEGGEVKGVNRAVSAPHLKGGMSKAGLETRVANDLGDHPAAKESRDEAKSKHRAVLAEMKAMPKPKLAKGGLIKQSEPKFAEVTGPFKVRTMKQAEEENLMSQDAPDTTDEDTEQMDEQSPSEEEIMAPHFADGGEVDNESELEHAASIAAAIMSKRKMMAEGGMLGDNMEDASEYNDLDEAALKEDYDSDIMDLDQPEDSNEHSPEHAEVDINDKDIVSAIRRKMRIKSSLVK